jgi:hypothetical protein
MRRWLATLTLCISLLIPVGLPVRPQDETAAELDEQRQTVYVIRTGEKYHSDRCRHLASRSNEFERRQSEGLHCLRGLSPASVFQHNPFLGTASDNDAMKALQRGFA